MAGMILVMSLIFFPPLAYGQATAWSYSYAHAQFETNGTGGGIKVTNLKHNNNLIMDRINLPYIWVQYGDGGGPVRDDFPLDIPCDPSACWGKVDHSLSKHTSSGQEYIHSIYLVGCQIWSSTANGCYKYEIQYWFYNDQPGSGTKPEMQMWLRAWGPGYYATRGVPTSYDVYWRADTDVLGSASDKYQRYTTSWTEVTSETAFTSIGSTDSGIEWRTYSGTDTTKRVEIWPVLADFDKIWLLRFDSTGTKADPKQYDGDPESYDNDAQSLSGQDDLYWMRTQRAGSECQPSSPCSQVHVITLSGI